MPAFDTPSTPANFAFFEPLRVRWAEVDMQGVVFNPNYLVYADVAMSEYMRAIGFSGVDGLAKLGIDMFAAGASVDFRASARFDDELRLGARVERFGRTSFQPRVAVFRGDELLADVGLTYVCVAPDEPRRTVPVPDAFIAACKMMDDQAA
ncbi:thioesterase family protein [Brevundimonas sp. M20]|uniref:acyl-CoA thioesterase n=1 Tax=Brevundimonas sp. M20 TaxID=2591463 RepID=UPI0011462667|nr:thioesterase family protein [Brevundimonas sp. M20]QDH72852.1 acyl-CoA thioesterase [Brevundimonas sp. M20]